MSIRDNPGPDSALCEHGTATRIFSCSACESEAAAELAEQERQYRQDTSNMSDQDSSLDEMVEQASRPSLKTLYQRGKSAGLIKPVQDYHHATVA